MFKYLDELKQNPIITQQIRTLKNNLELHNITKDFTNHDEIIDFMIVNRIRSIDNYIMVCEMSGRCLGNIDIQSTNKITHTKQLEIFNIELRKQKLKQLEQKRKLKQQQQLNNNNNNNKIIVINQQDNEIPQIQKQIVRKPIKPLKLNFVDQSRLTQEIPPNLINQLMEDFLIFQNKICQEFVQLINQKRL